MGADGKEPIDGPLITSRYVIDETRRVVRLAGPFPAELEDWCATLDAVFADPVYAPGCGFLSDRRGVTVLPPDAYILDAVQYLQAHRSQLTGCRWAFVTDTPAMDAWTRAVSLIAGSVGIRFGRFREIDAAWQWLKEDVPR